MYSLITCLSKFFINFMNAKWSDWTHKNMRKPFKVRSRLVFMMFFHEPKVPNEYLVRSLFCFILLYNSWFLRCTFSRRLNAEHKQSRGHKRYRNMNKEKYRNMNKDKFSKNPLPKKRTYIIQKFLFWKVQFREETAAINNFDKLSESTGEVTKNIGLIFQNALSVNFDPYSLSA